MIHDQTLLTRLRQELSDFVACLEAEAEALATMQPEVLSGAVETKQRLALTVAHTWNQTLSWLKSLAPEPDAAALDLPAELQPAWLDILNLAHRTKALNERNGQLVEAQLQRTMSALNILQTAAKPVNLYGSDGLFQDVPGLGHTLNKA
jgi:flagellar biosynthesis/type III secretory pathway chaperone